MTALDILEKRIPLIIMLGGTSGTGKSTVASILAARFGIATSLSSDSIRHMYYYFFIIITILNITIFFFN